MATQSIALPAEFEEFAAPFVESGRYPNSTEVLHAAMDALRRETVTAIEGQENAILGALAEEGEASGLAESDIFETIRLKYGWKPFTE